MTLACVLIADITGSTALFERVGTQDAMQHITVVVARMRELIEESGGVCVKSKGDDTVSFFDHPERAAQAAWNMIVEDWADGLSIHAGVYFGEVLFRESEIYGDAVNTAARLASAAKSGEVLIGHNCWVDLEATTQDKFVLIGELQFKGKQDPTRVYSCTDVKLDARTVIFSKSSTSSSRIESAVFKFGDENWRLVSGETLSIGRSPENDIVLNHAWVSRKHAQLTIRQGQLEYVDHSSSGSVLRNDDGSEVFVHRRTNLLSGSGRIFLGNGSDEQSASMLGYVTHELNISSFA